MQREWLIRIREAKGFSQAEVAKQSGIVQQSYQLIEKGTNTPRPDTAQRIGAVLGFPWTVFFDQDAADGFDWGNDGKSDNVDAFEE